MQVIFLHSLEGGDLQFCHLVRLLKKTRNAFESFVKALEEEVTSDYSANAHGHRQLLEGMRGTYVRTRAALGPALVSGLGGCDACVHVVCMLCCSPVVAGSLDALQSTQQSPRSRSGSLQRSVPAQEADTSSRSPSPFSAAASCARRLLEIGGSDGCATGVPRTLSPSPSVSREPSPVRE